MMQDDHPAPRFRVVPSDWDAEDAAIGQTLEQVDVPAAARERARARLRAAAAMSPADDGLVSAMPSGASASAQASHLVRLPQRPAVWSRRRALVGLAAAAGVASLSFFLMRSRPTSRDQLVQFCTSQLDSISATPPNWSNHDVAAVAQLAPLMRGVRERLTLVGYHRRDASELAEACGVWKFATSDGKSLYVFRFDAPRPVLNISGRLQVIAEASGGWSIAAMQRGSQLWVAAVDGNIERYFQSSPLA